METTTAVNRPGPERALATEAVHAGRDDLAGLGVHAVPLDLSTTYPSHDSRAEAARIDAFAATGGRLEGPPVYARLDNPTTARFEDRAGPAGGHRGGGRLRQRHGRAQRLPAGPRRRRTAARRGRTAAVRVRATTCCPPGCSAPRSPGPTRPASPTRSGPTPAWSWWRPPPTRRSPRSTCGRSRTPAARCRCSPTTPSPRPCSSGPASPGRADRAAQRDQVPRRPRGRPRRGRGVRRGVRAAAAAGPVRHRRGAAPARRIPAAARPVHPAGTGPRRVRDRRRPRRPARRRPPGRLRALPADRRRDGRLRGARRPARGDRRRPAGHPGRQPRQRRHADPAPRVDQPPRRRARRAPRQRGVATGCCGCRWDWRTWRTCGATWTRPWPRRRRHSWGQRRPRTGSVVPGAAQVPGTAQVWGMA